MAASANLSSGELSRVIIVPFPYIKTGFYMVIHYCYTLLLPRRGGSNGYPQIYVLSRNMKNIKFFLSENFHFLVVKFSVYLNRRVFVMIHRRAEMALIRMQTCKGCPRQTMNLCRLILKKNTNICIKTLL